MKRLLRLPGIVLLIMLFAGFKNTASAQPSVYVSYQTFYDELSPYGEWISYPEYGYVWHPDAGPDFRPYSSNGHWVWSDEYEWMWVSDYTWGWAPFHYGRWLYDDFYGWLWVPGYEWSPAWVAWRSSADYYGWAPLMPGINISFGFSIGSYSPPYNYWCFTPSLYITSPRIYNYCISPRQNVTIIHNTTIINNYNYNRNVFVTGPRRTDVEHYTNSRIHAVRVRDISSPSRAGFRHNEVAVYRPSVQRENNRTFAPKRFNEYKGSNAVARGNNFNDRKNILNDRNNARFERQDQPVRNNDNINRREGNRNNVPRPVENNERLQQRNNTAPVRNNNRPPVEQRSNNNTNNAVRERSVRDALGTDNRRGMDQPVQRSRFERQQPVKNNSNFSRPEMNRNANQPPANTNRTLSNNAQQQERKNSFNNRNFNRQPQPQRQPSPDMRRQEQPRQLAQPGLNRGNNTNRGGQPHKRG